MTIVNVDDFRRVARRRLPRLFFDYIDGGSFAEWTLARNRSDFDRWALDQRILRGHAVHDLTTTILGQKRSLPVMLGPVGFLGLYAHDGEIAAAKAATAAGVPFCLSTFSIRSIETIAAKAAGDLHFQYYVMDDEALNEEVLAAAERAGVSALYLTVDTAITGIRERDMRNGFRAATRPTPRMLLDMATRPLWLIDLLRGGMPAVECLKSRPDFGKGALEQAANLSRRIRQTLNWDDVDRLRARWKGKLVIKGVLSGEDARLARDHGADAVIISNHGGRQLDFASSTISILPEVVDAVEGGLEVLIDGGFRRGSDVIKAIALGASGVLLGRAQAFAVACGGERGVKKLLDIFSEEIRIDLALMGRASIAEIAAEGRAALRAVP